MTAPRLSQQVCYPLRIFQTSKAIAANPDQIRPGWEAKLASVRAAVARRANRRIVMRQVGDRLIPVGVTSGRVHTLPGADGADNGADGESGSGTGSRRRRGARTNGPADITQLLGQIGLGGQDLEEVTHNSVASHASFLSPCAAHGHGGNAPIAVGTRRAPEKGRREEAEGNYRCRICRRSTA